MTGTTFSSPSSYWQVSRAPRYSLLFALPLLLFYQLLAVLLAHGERSIRNGADVILQSLFTAVAGAGGPPLFLIFLIAAGSWGPPRGLRARRARLRGGGFVAGLGGRSARAVLFCFLCGGGSSGGARGPA